MALKQQPGREFSPLSGKDPAWGRLAEKGVTAPVVRFAVDDRTVSFPFHGFRRWEFSPGTPDRLTIVTGDETVTVQGQGLAAVRDALDAGSLMVLRTKPGRGPAADSGETIVTGIAFTIERK